MKARPRCPRWGTTPAGRSRTAPSSAAPASPRRCPPTGRPPPPCPPWRSGGGRSRPAPGTAPPPRWRRQPGNISKVYIYCTSFDKIGKREVKAAIRLKKITEIDKQA